MTQGYLAGPINACSDAEVTEWRERVKESLPDVKWTDPADRDFRGVENETFETIVEGDKADIDEVDFVLAYCWQPSYGTAMELIYAWEHHKNVYSVVPNGAPVSPWVRYHSTEVFSSLDAALEALQGT